MCAEAIRLGRVLVTLLDSTPGLPRHPEPLRLLALLLLHDSRRAARIDEQGELVLLEDQDRSRWDRGQIDEGLVLLDRALAQRQPGPVQIQAAISALHAQAAVANGTDWPQIAALYGELVRLAPSPAVDLNRAVAMGTAQRALVGLMELDQLQLEASLGE